MCGLFGSSSSFLGETEVEDTMTLGYLSRFRGKDSTGIALLNRKDEKGKVFKHEVFKETVPAGMFTDHPETRKFLKANEKPMVILGHTRAATGGALTRLNAQPFVHKHIIGAHNGMMDIYKDHSGDPEERSDSNLFFEEMASVGLKEALIHGNKSLMFAYALTWIDTKDMTLHFLHNKERPLWRIENNHKTTVYWASDPRFIEFMDRMSTTMFGNPVAFAVDVEYKLDLTTRKWSQESVVIPKSYPVSTTGFFLGRDWERGYYPPSWESDLSTENAPREVRKPQKSTNRETRRAQSIAERNKGSHIIVLDVTKKSSDFAVKDDDQKTYNYFGYLNKKYSLSEISPLLQQGCYFCNSVAKPQDIVWWRQETDYLCSDCHQLPIMKILESGDDYKKIFTRSAINVALKK